MTDLPTTALRRRPFDPALRAAALAIAAGLAMTCAVFAQDAQPAQGEEQPGYEDRGRDMAGEKPETPPAPSPDSAGPGEAGAANSPIRRAWSQIRGGQTEEPSTPAGGAQPRRLEIQENDAAAAAAPEELAPPLPDDVFTIETVGEPVQVGSLVDWVSKRLNINIFSDPGVADRTVTFNGPMHIKAAELLDFLSLIVEQQGFALTREREGWYVIRPAGQVAFNLGAGDLATTRIIPTPLLRPTALKVAVDAALASRGGGGGDASASNRIAYLDELGIIIITDTPRGLRSVEEIVKAVIGEARAQTFHRIDVVHINADLARSKVIELNGASSTTRGSAQRGNNQPIGQPAVATTSATLTNLPDRIFLDSESNALIFRGSAAEAQELTALVNAIDTPSKLIPKRYPAGPASPAICAYGERRGLGAVTTGPATGGSQFGGNSSFNNRASLGGQQGQFGTGTGSGFVLENSQEAFVYFGTAEQHEQVEALVESFADQARLARVVVEFYPLKHANAEEVAELLNAIVQDTSQQFGDSPFLPRGFGAQRVTQTAPTEEGGETTTTTIGGDGVGVSLTPSENISIQPDAARNQVVIKAPIRQQAEFASIVAQLDIRQPQVFIEAKVVSVITDDNFEFGLDWAATIDTANGTLNLFSNFGLQNMVGVAAGAPTAIGVFDGTDVDVVLNALSRVGETRILSTPRILVRDNGEAELNSTQERPYASTTQNAGTAVTSQGGTVEAGTKLTVSPQISSGGLVNLELSVELSDFIGEGTDGLQPPKQQELYTTTVSLPSDSTLIIGGLTFDRKADSVDKVPLLGDIPIIGQAFRNTSVITRKTTVFVFIRPVILRDESMTDLRLLTKGPLKDTGLDSDTPELQPERIPIRSGSLGSSLDRPLRLSPDTNDPS